MKRKDKDMEEQIFLSVLKSLPDDKLIEAKKFLDKLSLYKKFDKLYSTYIIGVEDSLKNTKNSRIYVEYNLDGTVTGRLSNSGATIGDKKEDKLGISFHTMPKEKEDLLVNIRDYLIAPPDWDFISVDEKGCELRVLAHVADEKNMLKAFHSGVDMHTYSAAMIYNKDPKDVNKYERQESKEVSFLTVYGGKAFTLAQKKNISEAKAQEIIDSWMELYPRIPVYMDTVRDYIQQHKYIKSLFGRRRNLPNIDSPVDQIREAAWRQGLNYTVQSPANDIILCNILGLYNKLKERNLKAKIIGTVHDSCQIICPRNETQLVLKLVYNEFTNYNYMKNTFGIYLKAPLEVEIEIGTSFGNGKKVDLSSFDLTD